MIREHKAVSVFLIDARTQLLIHLLRQPGIENTDYHSEIDVDFLDANGVVVYQTADYLSNIKPGSKIKSSIYYYEDITGGFDRMDIKVSAWCD